MLRFINGILLKIKQMLLLTDLKNFWMVYEKENV